MGSADWLASEHENQGREVHKNGTEKQKQDFESASKREGIAAAKASGSFITTMGSVGTGNIPAAIEGAKATISNVKEARNAMSERYKVVSEVRKNKE